MYESDKRILRLIEILIFQKKISYINDFHNEIGIVRQTASKVKKGINHFTVLHIEKICKAYNVNANWIFGFEDNVFNEKNSIIIKKV